MLPGLTLREGLRSPAFIRLFVAGGSYAFYTMSVSPNLVPIMTELGSTAMAAAGIASVLGVGGFVSRVSAGWLIDRLPAHLVGAFMFLVAVAGCATLLAGGAGIAGKTFAAACFGATVGAEFDVVIYLVSRHFGLRAFGALMGTVLTAGAIGGAIAPWAAGRIHDVTGSYDGMLWMLVVLLVINAVSMATMPRPPKAFAGLGH
jgi:fucose permease